LVLREDCGLKSFFVDFFLSLNESKNNTFSKSPCIMYIQYTSEDKFLNLRCTVHFVYIAVLAYAEHQFTVYFDIPVLAHTVLQFLIHFAYPEYKFKFVHYVHYVQTIPECGG